MTETRFDGAGPTGPSGDQQPGEGWGRRPRRSENDRKVAGVAGGLGRAVGIDPVLIRVAFVVLALFGGSGVLLYALGWLLLPSDRDQASAAEALLGRGRSSVSPALAVGLAIIALISAISMFSWGLPFFPAPVVIAAVVIFFLVKRHRGGGRYWTDQQRQEWLGRMDAGVRDLSDRASRIGSNWGGANNWGGNWGSSAGPSTTSPFETPAFWERDGHGSWRVTTPTHHDGGVTDMPAPSAADRVDAPAPPVSFVKNSPTEPQVAPEPVAPTPPTWDPLGVAPFAWDLPEPTPLVSDEPAQVAGRRRDSGVVTRVTMGIALLGGGLAAVGVVFGWWDLTWAQVSGIALAIVATGLLLGSLRGRGRGLIGHGIFLSLVTAALTVTGISGTSGYGEELWTPMQVTDVQSDYTLNGGQGVLDLSRLQVAADTTTTTEVEVKAGHAEVILPKDTNYTVSCSSNAGRIECLDQVASGWGNERTVENHSFTDKGTVNLTVHVGAGFAEVRNG